MACASLLLVTMLATAAPEIPDAVRQNAQPALPASLPVAHETFSRRINLSVAAALHDSAMEQSDERLSAPENSGFAGGADVHPSINLGPLHTEFGGVTGRRMNLATMRLEGVSVFGGSVGGSISSRSARITLSWPANP
jgi:hypothetical protein